VRQESCTPCTTRAASGSLTRCSSTEAYIDSGRLVKVVLEAKDEQMKAEGVEFIEIDNKPFYDATAPVRAKYGAQFADLMKRIADVK